MEEKTGFIYIWFDKKRKMYYIGCHYGTENDGYICSSNRMRDAYRRRPNDFKRRIIKRNIDRNLMLEEEHKWLSLIPDDQLGKKYYNLSNRHFGHWSNDENKIKNISEKISEKNKGKKYPNRKRPKPFSEEHRRKMSESRLGNKNSLGRIISEDHKRKISISSRGRKHTEDALKKIREARSKQIITEETKRKISETQKGKILSEETKRKMSESRLGKKRPKRINKHKEV